MAEQMLMVFYPFHLPTCDSSCFLRIYYAILLLCIHIIGIYSHRQFSKCLADRVGDDLGSSHSPVYGWIIDGFPIYGPYNDAGVLANSCWKRRDYSQVKNATTGCGAGAYNKRGCLLKNMYDITAGTASLAADQYGPDIGRTILSNSQNPISTNNRYMKAFATLYQLLSLVLSLVFCLFSLFYSVYLVFTNVSNITSFLLQNFQLIFRRLLLRFRMYLSELAQPGQLQRPWARYFWLPLPRYSRCIKKTCLPIYRRPKVRRVSVH
jgi:hypothetical protein